MSFEIRTLVIMRVLFRFQFLFYSVSFTLISCHQRENGALSDALEESSYFFFQNAEYARDCEEVLDQCSATNASGVYLIRPHGYPTPFEVYCHNSIESGGWTIIQRRLDGSVTFERRWEDYKTGFGFLATEFWLGNEKLSYLTNQATYELRMDLLMANGTKLRTSYDHFRISDEWSNFSMTSVGNSVTDGSFTQCPANMIYGNCTCRPTCEDPTSLNDSYCNCGESDACICPDGFLLEGNDCVAPNECSCFVPDENSVIPEGGFLVNSDCSVKYSCLNQTLVEDPTYSCDSNAECKVVDQIQRCFCRSRFDGNGESCTLTTFRDCLEAYNAGVRENGVYTISPSGWSGLPFDVYCNMNTTDGGGWTVFQRRSDGSTDFYRNWEDYKNGFGNLDNEFWLGNEKLHFLTSQRNHLLRVDITTSGGSNKYDKYTSFVVDDESTGYRVSDLEGHTGNAGNGFYKVPGESFSTYDRDNDGWSTYNCAQKHRGAWWYSDYLAHCGIYDYIYCNYWRIGGCGHGCTRSNPNGDYNGGNGENLFWHDYHDEYCNVRSVEMMIRPS